MVGITEEEPQTISRRRKSLRYQLRKIMDAFHLHFFLVKEGPAEGDLARAVIRGAGNWLEIEL